MAIPLLWMALTLAGLSWAQIHRYYAPPGNILHRLGERPTLVRVKASIEDQPSRRAGVIRGTESLAARARLIAIEDRGTWQPASGEFLLRVEPAGELELSPGQEFAAIGNLSRIAPPANPGEYDWQTHFARESIFMRLSVAHWETVRPLTPANMNIFWRAKAHVRKALASGFAGEENRALAMALLLGDSSDVLEQAWADFRASGTAHHLSISGTHIAILTGFLLLIGRCAMLHPRTVLIVATVFAIGYASLARPSPPVVRSVLLCMALATSILLRRNTDPLQCLFVAVLLMLLYCPMDLTSPGFQLSFGAVAALMLFTRRVNAWFWSFENEHDRIARIIRPPRGIAAMWHWTARCLVQALSAGIVAYCVSLPLVAIHFRQVNPWAIPGSILLAPFVTTALIAGLLKIAVCSLFASAGELLAVPTEAATSAMRYMVGVLARLPGAEVGIGAVPQWLIALYCALIALPLVRPISRWRHRWIAPCAAVIVFSLGPLLPDSRGDQTRITFLSVGNGNCTVVECPGGEVIFIDCGAARQRDLFGRTIQPFLRERGLRKVDAVIITHSDSDHDLALPDIVSAYSPQVHRTLPLGKVLELAKGVEFEVLGPSASFSNDNDSSIVLRLQYAGRSILFTGDIEEDGIDALLRSGRHIASDVLIAPHHGSIEKNTGALLVAVRPSLIICSSSSRLSGTQQRFVNLVGSRYPLLRTGDCGAITVTIDARGALDVRGFRNQP